MRAPVTRNPHAADLLLLHHAVHGCTGLGIIVWDETLYLHVEQEGERFLIDVTGGGTLVGGRAYAAIIASAEASYERAAVSLAGLKTFTLAEPVAVPVDEHAVLPFVETTVAEDYSGDATELFDMGRARERKVIGSDDLPPMPWLDNVSGQVSAERPILEEVEGW